MSKLYSHGRQKTITRLKIWNKGFMKARKQIHSLLYMEDHHTSAEITNGQKMSAQLFARFFREQHPCRL